MLVDSIVSPSLYWGTRTHTDHRVSTPCWPHSSFSKLVFPEGLPSRYRPGSNLLSFSRQPVLVYRVIWLLVWLLIKYMSLKNYKQHRQIFYSIKFLAKIKLITKTNNCTYVITTTLNVQNHISENCIGSVHFFFF